MTTGLTWRFEAPALSRARRSLTHVAQYADLAKISYIVSTIRLRCVLGETLKLIQLEMANKLDMGLTLGLRLT